MAKDMRQKHNEELGWMVCILIVLALGYLKVRYFWPWFVKWCMAQ